MHKYVVYFALFALMFLASCNKDIKEFNYLNFTFQFDATQERLDNFGNVSNIPSGNAAQTPTMRSLSVHYLELAYDQFTQYKDGAVIYKAPETHAGGNQAIAFDSSVIASANEIIFTTNVNKLPNGTYNYVRASVAYQNYDVNFTLRNIPVVGDLSGVGTIASFLGYETYITSLQVNNLSISINGNKTQGFWAFETQWPAPYEAYNAIYTGQAPEGATTVVNPLFATSPVPPGSCVITGKFAEPLVIDDDIKSNDITITLSFSINQSFEWIDTNGNGIWDIDATDPDLTEKVVDMGLRGMIPSYTISN